MRIRRRLGRRQVVYAPVSLAASLAVLVAAVSLTLGQEPDIAAELANSGVQVEPLTGDGFITREEALAVADEVQDDAFKSAARDAALVSVSDPTTMRGDEQVSDRPLWIVRYSGLAIPVGGPVREDGTTADGGVFTTAYIYIDAINGEWLFTRLEG